MRPAGLQKIEDVASSEQRREQYLRNDGIFGKDVTLFWVRADGSGI